MPLMHTSPATAGVDDHVIGRPEGMLWHASGQLMKGLMLSFVMF